MGAVEVLNRYWPIILFILGVTFILGGYAVMITGLKEQINILFNKSTSRDAQMHQIDIERAVLQNELTNMKHLMEEMRGMIASLVAELRQGGHVRKGDIPS